MLWYRIEYLYDPMIEAAEASSSLDYILHTKEPIAQTAGLTHGLPNAHSANEVQQANSVQNVQTATTERAAQSEQDERTVQDTGSLLDNESSDNTNIPGLVVQDEGYPSDERTVPDRIPNALYTGIQL